MLSWWKSRGEDPRQSPRQSHVAKHVIRSASVGSADKSQDTKNDKDTSLLPHEKIPPLSYKDFVVFLVEIIMAYCSQIIRERNADAHNYQSQTGKTRTEIERDLLFIQGWAAPGSLLAGFLGDGYIGTYYLALTSIIMVFIMATCLLFEQIMVGRLRINPYADLMTWVAAIAHFLNHSTGFSRVVFGLENMRNKKPSAVLLFLFIFTLLGDISSPGGVLMLAANLARLDTRNCIRLGCYTSGLSVLLFVIIFKSISTENTDRSDSRKAIRCFVHGLWRICTDWCVKKSFRDHVYRHYDKSTVNRAKGLCNFAVLLCPILGFVFFVVGRFENLYNAMGQLVTPTGIHYYIGISAGIAMSTLLTMVITYFLVIPGLAYLGMPRQFNYHFSLGYFFALIAMYYMAVVLKVNEVYKWDSEIGYIRIFNARDSDVVFISRHSPLNSNFTVPAHSAATGTFVITSGDAEMLLTAVLFDDDTNVTLFMRVEAKKCISYAVVDPPEVIELSKPVPLFEGPPMTNDYRKPRIYLFNGARALKETAIHFRDLSTGQWILIMMSTLGSTRIFQIPPGDYQVWVENTDLQLTHQFNDGGLYGIMLLTDITSNFLELDVVTQKKELGSMTITYFTIFYGMSLTFSYVTLRTMTYIKAPDGLLCTTFGYFSFQENLAVWVLVLGYHTWHQQIYGDELLKYCFALSFLFFTSLFIMLKYSKLYTYSAYLLFKKK